MNYFKTLIIFVVTFCILYAIYYFFIIRKCKKNKEFVPVEVNLILIRYHINTKKIDLYQMIKLVSLVTVTILSMVITIVLEFSLNTFLSIIIATIVSVIFAILCYDIIGKIYKNRSIK